MDTQTTDPLPKRDAGGELLRLRWDHIDLETGITYLPSSKTLKDKTGLGQEIVMQRELIDLLNRLPKRLEWVFYRSDSNPYLRDHIYGPFKKALRSLGINVRKYSLKEIRHTTGSQMNLKGAPPLVIKDQLRHTTVKTRESFYIGSDTEFQRAQAEKLVFNDLPLS